VSLEVADTTTAAFVGSDGDDLAEAARQFFAAGGERLHLVRCDSDPEAMLARLDGLDVSLVASPGAGIDAIEAGARYCERRGDCFFVAEAAPGIAERVRSSFAALFPSPSAAAAGELAAAPVWESTGRTLSPDPEWKYVSVRRTAIFIERSIEGARGGLPSSPTRSRSGPRSGAPSPSSSRRNGGSARSRAAARTRPTSSPATARR
jgi:hypothetical protein